MNERNKLILQRYLGHFAPALIIIFQILSFIAVFVPLHFLDLSFWGYIGLMTLLFLPTIGSILEFILYCITFSTVISEPFSFWIVLYYISLAVFLLTTVFPVFIDIIISVANMISRHRNS